MKRIKKYQEFTNEEINWKSIVPAIALATTLNLSSCKTKEEVENKMPEVELFIQKHIDSRSHPQGVGFFYSGITSENKPYDYKDPESTFSQIESNTTEKVWEDESIDITFDKIVEIREIDSNRLVMGQVNKEAKFYFIISRIKITSDSYWNEQYLVDVYCELPDNTGGVIHDLFFALDKQELENKLAKYSSSWCMQEK